MMRYYQHKITENSETLKIEQEELALVGDPQTQFVFLARDDIKTINDYQSATKNLIYRLSEWQKTEGCFTGMSEQNNTVIFTGKTRDATALTALLTKWGAYHLFSDFKLEQLAYQEKGRFIKFNFRATLTQKQPGGEI
jgi:hypothetical protein